MWCKCQRIADDGTAWEVNVECPTAPNCDVCCMEYGATTGGTHIPAGTMASSGTYLQGGIGSTLIGGGGSPTTIRGAIQRARFRLRNMMGGNQKRVAPNVKSNSVIGGRLSGSSFKLLKK